MKTKKEMIAYLISVDTYPTMNSWNGSYGYSYNVKISSLPLSHDEKDKLYSILDDESLSMQFYDSLNFVIGEWENKINTFFDVPRYDPMNHMATNEDKMKQFTIGFNGRSGGHLVLYKWNGYNYGGGSWIFDKEELEEMTRDEVKEIYTIVRMFENCKNDLLTETKYFASREIETVTEDVTSEVTYKQFIEA